MPISPGRTYCKSEPETSDFNKLFKSEVVEWLDPKIRLFILDYLTIKNSHNSFGVQSLSDYSYLITPAFKALEGVLFQVGQKLGFQIEDYKFKIGVVFSDDNLEKFYNDVLAKVEGLPESYKNDIQMWLNDARRILRHFRHSPAHYMGEAKTSWEDAFSFGDHILRTINEMCYSLIKSQVFLKIHQNSAVGSIS